MANVATNIICCWPSTAASIPSGWSRETNLDAVYIQGASAGADADLTTVRGAATHTHTSPSHTPTQISHNHSFSGAASAEFIGISRNVSSTVLGAIDGHTHASTQGAAATGTNNGVTITVNANTSNDLGYLNVIFIKSDGAPTGVPVNGYGFFASDALPTNWTRVQGNQYLKGAATNGDGGGTGGANTHSHTSPAHTHTQNSHAHNVNLSADSSSGLKVDQTDFVASFAVHTHKHTVDFSSTTPTNQSVTTTVNSANHEPVYKKLNIINNGNTGADLPDQLILLWGGTNAGIPANWARFTSMDGNFLKGANLNGESNVTTGGATTHIHTASNCQPIQDAHTHTASTDYGPNTTDLGSQVGIQLSISTDVHTHSWTVSSFTALNNSVAVTVNANTAESAYPLYRRIIFIQYTAPAFSPKRTILGVGT